MPNRVAGCSLRPVDLAVLDVHLVRDRRKPLVEQVGHSTGERGLSIANPSSVLRFAERGSKLNEPTNMQASSLRRPLHAGSSPSSRAAPPARPEAAAPRGASRRERRRARATARATSSSMSARHPRPSLRAVPEHANLQPAACHSGECLGAGGRRHEVRRDEVEPATWVADDLLKLLPEQCFPPR